MKATQHTQGKWELLKLQQPIEGFGSFVIRSGEAPGGIAISVGGIGKEEDHNMQLLFAAPDLLEAVKLALRNEESRLYMLPASDDDEVSAEKDILSAAIGLYRAAITKATTLQP